VKLEHRVGEVRLGSFGALAEDRGGRRRGARVFAASRGARRRGRGRSGANAADGATPTTSNRRRRLGALDYGVAQESNLHPLIKSAIRQED
jgi:hypothetical protein